MSDRNDGDAVSRETTPTRSQRLEAARKKWFFQSKTIIGALVAALPAIGALVGIELPEPEIASIEGQLLGLADAINELIGLGLVVWGRVSARGNVKFIPDLPVKITITKRE